MRPWIVPLILLTCLLPACGDSSEETSSAATDPSATTVTTLDVADIKTTSDFPCPGSSDDCTSESSTAADPSTTTVTTLDVADIKTDADFPCPGSSDDCTSAERLATVEQLYRIAGATPGEARCLAPLSAGRGRRALNEVFPFAVPTAAETQAANKCFGSEDRARMIATAMANYVTALPPG